MNAAPRQKVGNVNTAKPTLIGICGLKGSGKSEVASRLSDQLQARRIRFAGPLKDMLRALGLTEHEIEGHLKEEPCEKLCGKTPREAMVSLGTEWGRDLVGANLWSRSWERKAAWVLADGISVVAEDLRFPNEYDAIRRLGGLVLRVTRPGVVAGSHESEAHALRLPADIYCHNDGNLDDLEHWVNQVLPNRIALAEARIPDLALRSAL